MSDIFLSAEHVTKQFAEHTALADVSIAVPRGSVFGLLGPNGAGKTTLIRIINRITAPDSGTVTFDGHPLSPDDIAHIGYLPEERGLYKKMKVGEQAVYLAQLKGLSEREATRRLTVWFEKFGIMPWWNKKLEELSKGMQQKVQFVITVLHEPKLLIFDEPFSGFDPVNAQLLKDEILGLRDRGHTVIFSTHNMSSVEEVCDEIALVNKGRIVLNGKVGEVRNSFRKGLFEVVGSGAPLQNTAGFTVRETTPQDSLTRYLVQAAEGLSSSALIRQLSEQLEIRSFAEHLPSMNDIFIQTVGAPATEEEPLNATNNG